MTEVMIERRTVTPEGFGRYEVALELALHARKGAGPGGSDPVKFPYVPTTGCDGVATTDIFAGVVPTGYHSGEPPGWPYYEGMPLNPANLTDGNTGTYTYVNNGVIGGGTWITGFLFDMTSPRRLDDATLLFTGSSPDTGIESWWIQGSTDGGAWTDVIVPADWTEHGGGLCTAPSGNTSLFRYWRLERRIVSGGLVATGGMQIAELTSGGCVPVAIAAPRPGQWVNGETPTPAPDGTTTTFSTLWPFADGSLRVTIDGIEMSTSIASYDGAAGTFTLSWAPDPGETMSVRYQGR